MRVEPWHVCVIIPARNEEQLLRRCLRSVTQALCALPKGTTSDVVVAVDSSTDRTGEIAVDELQVFGTVVCTDAGSVGSARAIATEVALRRYQGSRCRCWLANTDADCVAPEGWLNEQLLLAANGAEVVAGTVDVDTFDEHLPVVKDRFRATYPIWPDGTHPHVHGANLGFRADVYLRAGGWNELLTGEDHDLWKRLSNVGARKLSVSHVEILTSGRRVGRAPHGFAEALAAHNETVA